jgi:hypothetical protein
MHWTFLGNLEQTLALLIGERPLDLNGAFDTVHFAFPGLTLGTVACMNFFMVNPH